MRKSAFLLILALVVAASSYAAVPSPRYMVMDMVHHNPGEAPTRSKFLNPDYLKKSGYDAKVFFLFDAAQFGIDWKDFEPEAFSEEASQWVRAKNDSITARYNAAKDAGLDVYCMLDMLVLPKQLVEKHRDVLTDSEGKIDISKPFTQNCVRYLIRSMFEAFPQLDGLIIRTGETYLHDAPYYVGNHPVRHGMSDHITLINILRDEVCDKSGKNLIYRTWDFGKLHSLPKYYRGVTDSIIPHPNLYFSIKHTATDFWRMGITDDAPVMDSLDVYWLDESGRYGMSFNPCIGIGSHKQIVEVQCQREYEGKGAHPNYIAHGVIDGFRELQGRNRPYALSHLANDSLFSGVWTWSRGGGWGGPYITNEFWIDLNARVMAEWAANPSKSEEECFNDVALALGVAEKGLDKFRRLCLLAEDGVLKGQYSSYGGTYVNWTRDDTMTGDAFLNRYFDRIIKSDETERYLQEKEEAVEIWREIEALAGGIDFVSPETAEFVAVTGIYGRIKYEILATAWKIMLKSKAQELAGIVYDRDELKNDIAHYDRLWDEWRQLKADHPSCPSLYRSADDAGIDETIDRYRN